MFRKVLLSKQKSLEDIEPKSATNIRTSRKKSRNNFFSSNEILTVPSSNKAWRNSNRFKSNEMLPKPVSN